MCDNMADVDRLFDVDVVEFIVVCGVVWDDNCSPLEVFWCCGMLAVTIEAFVVIGTKLFTEYLQMHHDNNKITLNFYFKSHFFFHVSKNAWLSYQWYAFGFWLLIAYCWFVLLVLLPVLLLLLKLGYDDDLL